MGAKIRAKGRDKEGAKRVLECKEGASLIASYDEEKKMKLLLGIEREGKNGWVSVQKH